MEIITNIDELIRINGNAINQIFCGDCIDIMNKLPKELVHLTFLDPPFNQQKDYSLHDDSMQEEDYWNMMEEVCSAVFERTIKGGAIYFMQREKNSEFVLQTLRKTG
jgi:DNA modification methylase